MPCIVRFKIKAAYIVLVKKNLSPISTIISRYFLPGSAQKKLFAAPIYSLL